MGPAASASKLGIIAGGGVLPGLLIKTCKAEGRPFYVLGLRDYADPGALGQEPDSWIRLGEAGKGFKHLKAAGVSTIVMGGTVRRPTLRQLRPDLKTAFFFARLAGRAVGDDGLLRAVIAEAERDGFAVVGPHEILSDLVAKPGVLGIHEPDLEAETDIRQGIAAAIDLGRRDVGQAVVVQQGVVLGSEDQEGTAALIARCAELKRAGPGGVLVKMKKPQQDTRIDLPAVGTETIEQAAKAGLRGIAVEAGGALILDPDAVRRAADAVGLFVVGVSP